MARENAEIRRLAAAVYAELKGTHGLEYMRELLADKDPEVRGIAAGVLARHRDEESIGRFAKATSGLLDADLGCKVVKELGAWKDIRVVPALVNFLENDNFAYQSGDDVGIPALKAREALHAITGCHFPYEVKAASDTWERVVAIADAEQRGRKFAEIMGVKECPLNAALLGKKDDASLRVTNRSREEVIVTRRPGWVEVSSESGFSSATLRGRTEASRPVNLAPGQSVTVRIGALDLHAQAKPSSRVIKLFYDRLADGSGSKGWMGWLEVKVGKGWQDPTRIVNEVVEQWPNGNYKVRGQTLNGKRHGVWTWYNEAGNRTRYVDYAKGLTANCNPDHPDNRGVGVRKKP
jgi:hypothetical protein